MREIFILALIQGISEWFPISSSGHLFLFHKFLGINPDITLDVFLHVSSLIVILFFFRTEILKILKGLLTFEKNNEDFKMFFYIISTTLITGMIGLFLKDLPILEDERFVSFGFLITSILLFFSNRKGERKINLKTSLIVGFVQGFALIPGISRSGSTISICKIFKIKDEDAFNFSFLIAIPTILGAVLIKLKEIKNFNPTFLLIGFTVSLLMSFITLTLLKKIVIKNKIKYFCIYTFLVFLISLLIR